MSPANAASSKRRGPLTEAIRERYGTRPRWLRLQIDAAIQVGERTFQVTLRYPNHFPHSPALVLPTDEKERWSGHQWGAGGELCLEYGPDNWHPDITGAMMLESAERLLRGERPEAGGPGDVATRHRATTGQQLRSSSLRLLMTKELRSALDAVPDGAACVGKLIVHIRERKCIYFVQEITTADGTVQDFGLPAPLADDGWERPLAIFRLNPDGMVPSAGTLVDLRVVLADQGLVLGDETYCLVVKGEVVRPFLLWSQDDTATEITVIPLSNDQRRLDPDHENLAGKKVAVLGCGSLGGKIAVSLARCGVGSFLLIDDDLMLPENLVRNDLDWREVGHNKVDAVSRRIRLVSPTAIVQTRTHRLGGQEASGSIENLIEAIAECDLVLDCTADPKVFNYLCAAVAVGGKPMAWAEVFGGGIGGLIARHRPTLDPDPASMRAMIEQFCQDRGRPVVRAGARYDQRPEDGPPLIADDGDVSAIAAHATRLAVDTLLARSPSMFPASAYLIGPSEGWIFDQPFETWPVDVGRPATAEEATPPDTAVAEEEMGIVRELFRKFSDAPDRT